MYLDSAYIAKYYVNEPDSVAVRAVIESADSRVTSIWAIAEFTCALHRHIRQGYLSETQARKSLDQFLQHVSEGRWQLIHVTDRLLRRCSAALIGLPATVFLRAGDAVHLTTAFDAGETEIWTNDRHLLAAAPYFGITGRSA